MSSTERGESCDEKFDQSSLDNEEDYLTEEDGISDESNTESTTKKKNITGTKNHSNLEGFKKTVRKKHARYSHHQYRTKNEFRKCLTKKSCKKSLVKNPKFSENSSETPKKGKRCRLGGKAKGKPPEEEGRDKHDSDEETDSGYFSRISLGYFQKFKDKNGASTSYQLEEEYKRAVELSNSTEKLEEDKITEELELLELQRWGRTNLFPSTKENDKLEEI